MGKYKEIFIFIGLMVVVILSSILVSTCFGPTVQKQQDQLRQEQLKQTQLNKKSNDEKNKVKTAEPSKKFGTDYKSQEKLKEMITAINLIFSKNVFNFAYDGCQWKSPDTLIIYVNENWNLMSKDQKIGMINIAINSWAGMCGVRDIKLDEDSFEVRFIHSLSNREVGKWGGFRGTRVFDD